jgi:hypothetical protein
MSYQPAKKSLLSNCFETDFFITVRCAFRFCAAELRGHCVLLFFTTLQAAERIKNPSSYYICILHFFACTAPDTLLITVYPQIFLIIVWLSMRDWDTENQLRAIRGDLYFIPWCLEEHNESSSVFKSLLHERSA